MPTSNFQPIRLLDPFVFLFFFVFFFVFFFIEVHIFYDKQCSSRSAGFFKTTYLDLHCLLRQGMSCSARVRLRDKTHIYHCQMELSVGLIYQQTFETQIKVLWHVIITTNKFLWKQTTEEESQY